MGYIPANDVYAGDMYDELLCEFDFGRITGKVAICSSYNGALLSYQSGTHGSANWYSKDSFDRRTVKHELTAPEHCKRPHLPHALALIWRDVSCNCVQVSIRYHDGSVYDGPYVIDGYGRASDHIGIRTSLDMVVLEVT